MELYIFFLQSIQAFDNFTFIYNYTRENDS